MRSLMQFKRSMRIMRRLAFLFTVLFYYVPNAAAENLYVSDFVRVTLRSGPGVDYRVIDMVGTGQKVEPLERGQEWTKVRVEDGKEGWMLTRHLTDDTPNAILVERLREENGRYKAKLADFSSTNTRLSEEAKTVKKDLETSRAELSALKADHDALKKGATGYLDLKTKYESVAAELKEVAQRAESYEKELTRIQLHQNIRWFLSGAGVLVVGFLIGFSSKRQRRRSSLL